MKYKGLEIMQMISKGQIEDGTRFDFENNNFNGEVEYYNGTLYWIRFDENWNETGKKNLFEMFNIQSTMVADFEPLKDEIDIDSIIELEEFELDQFVTMDKNERFDRTMIEYSGILINELVFLFSYLNKEVKELKED